MSQLTDRLKRRLRRFVGRSVRRLGVLPVGMADRLGDDASLLGSTLAEEVMVYFPDTKESLYQLRQWYEPLKALHREHPVIVVCLDSRTAKLVREESGLRCVTIARYSTTDDLLSRSNVKLALYVNHNWQNFINLRFLSVVHVHLQHGDGDKAVSVSNQLKAYDFSFVAGQAAVDRAARHIMLYDAKARIIPIGLPQVDAGRPAQASRTPGTLPTVLYAPTWEGAQPSVSYSSLPSHGEKMVDALLASGRYRVIYRPHPLAGVTDEATGQADLRVRSLVSRAAEQAPGIGHRVDTAGEFRDSAAESDLLLCDVSAVTVEYLPTGKPLVVTVSANPQVAEAKTRLLDVVARVTAGDAERIVGIVDAQLQVDPQRTERLDLVEYYVGDTTPGVATRRFIEACEHAMSVRDAAWPALEGPKLVGG